MQVPVEAPELVLWGEVPNALLLAGHLLWPCHLVWRLLLLSVRPDFLLVLELKSLLPKFVARYFAPQAGWPAKQQGQQ